MTRLIRDSNFFGRRKTIITDDHDFIDLTDITSINSEEKKRKMRPPNTSDRQTYSYANEIDVDVSDVQLINDNADSDAEHFFSSAEDQVTDLEGEDRSIGSMLDIINGGQGIQPGATEITFFPASNTRTVRRII